MSLELPDRSADALQHSAEPSATLEPSTTLPPSTILQPSPTSQPSPTLQPSTTSRPKAPDLTRDQRRDICLLKEIGWSFKQIQNHLQFKPTKSQIRYAIRAGRPSTPKKRTGRPPLLTQAQTEELIEFICASKENRRMSYEKLAAALDFGVGKDAIRCALAREGFDRRSDTRRPPGSEKSRQGRSQQTSDLAQLPALSPRSEGDDDDDDDVQNATPRGPEEGM